jgi:hypothetical protein
VPGSPSLAGMSAKAQARLSRRLASMAARGHTPAAKEFRCALAVQCGVARNWLVPFAAESLRKLWWLCNLNYSTAPPLLAHCPRLTHYHQPLHSPSPPDPPLLPPPAPPPTPPHTFAHPPTHTLRRHSSAPAAPRCPGFAPESFTHVLLDAPCTALGLRPKLQQPLTLTQLLEAAAYQRQLLAAAVHLVRPGGYLVFSTCSISPGAGGTACLAVLQIGVGVRLCVGWQSEGGGGGLVLSTCNVSPGEGWVWWCA